MMIRVLPPNVTGRNIRRRAFLYSESGEQKSAQGALASEQRVSTVGRREASATYNAIAIANIYLIIIALCLLRRCAVSRTSRPVTSPPRKEPRWSSNG